MSVPAKYRNPFSYYYYSEHDDGLTRWLKSISLLSALIAILIFTDYYLPLKEERHTIKNLIVRTDFQDFEYGYYQKQRSERTGEEEFWLVLNKEELAISEEDLKKLSSGGEFTLYKTTIFGINVKGRCSAIDHDIIPYFNVYGFLLIIPILFILFFVLNIAFGKNTQVILSVGVLNIILLVGYGFLILFY